MPRAVLATFLGFALTILLGLVGAWSADRVGAFVGIIGGLGFSFLATAYIMGR